MLLTGNVAWSGADDRSFDVTLEDNGRRVTGRVQLDERGALTDFSTIDRYGHDPGAPGEVVRARWTTPVAGWSASEAQPLPLGAEALWHFDAHEFACAKLSFSAGELELDV